MLAIQSIQAIGNVVALSEGSLLLTGVAGGALTAT